MIDGTDVVGKTNTQAILRPVELWRSIAFRCLLYLSQVNDSIAFGIKGSKSFLEVFVDDGRKQDGLVYVSIIQEDVFGFLLFLNRLLNNNLNVAPIKERLPVDGKAKISDNINKLIEGDASVSTFIIHASELTRLIVAEELVV